MQARRDRAEDLLLRLESAGRCAQRLSELALEQRHARSIYCAGKRIILSGKKLYRLYWQERLMVTKRHGRKRALGTEAPMAIPQGANQPWSLEFVSDALLQPKIPHPGGRR